MSDEKKWDFKQWFRKTGANEALSAANEFAINALEFNRRGSLVATGDNAGNIVILKNNRKEAKDKGNVTQFEHYCEFLAFLPDFDFAVRKPIEPAITSMKWGPKTATSNIMVASNSHQIKVFRVQDKEVCKYHNFNKVKPPKAVHVAPNGRKVELEPLDLHGKSKKKIVLKVPKIEKKERSVSPVTKQTTFKGAHQAHIKLLTVSRDQETYLSACPLKINQWSYTRDDICQSLIQLDPSPGTLQFVITSLDHHPSKPHIYLYGTSRGKLNLCDLRQRVLGTKPSKSFDGLRRAANIAIADRTLEDQVMIDEASMFDEVTSGITGMQFSGGGRFIITRDYMSVKIWDLNYEKRPIETLYVQEFLRPRLFELHEHNRTWQDSFNVAVSPQGDIATGTYSNYFHIFELGKKTDVFVQASTRPNIIADMSKMNRKTKMTFYDPGVDLYNNPEPPVSQRKPKGIMSKFRGQKTQNPVKTPGILRHEGYPLHLPFQTIDFNKKASHISWHPTKDTIAVASDNNLYLYSKC